jgi:integrase
MCSYLHRAPNGVYYFRMGIPADLRPFMSGKREIKHSLGLKDREEAKAVIPDMTKAAHTLLDQAKLDKASAAKPAPKPTAPKSAAQIERDRQQWEHEQEAVQFSADTNFAADMEHEALEPVMDALATGIETDADAVDIARAARLQILHEREQAALDRDALLSSLHARYGKNARASESQNQAVECQPTADNGKGIYLDTDILNGWTAERKPEASALDMYQRDAKLFYKIMGRKSVALLTKADVMAFKRKLIDDPTRSQVNVRDRLANLRTLLEWAAQNDVIPDNPARDVRMRVTDQQVKREDWSVNDLNTLFSGPVHAKGERPKGFASGEAAYWLPLLAVFMGARREELGQLRVQDVREEQYFDTDSIPYKVWCLDITDEGDTGNRLKNAYSRRLVPIHPKLIELGFVEYVTKLPDQAGQVFPLLKRVGIKQRLTDKWGQWFTAYRRELGISDKQVFHGLRHTWKTHAVNVGMAERVARQFQGHAGKDIADKYGSAPAMSVMVAAIASYRVPGLEIGKP